MCLISLKSNSLLVVIFHFKEKVLTLINKKGSLTLEQQKNLFMGKKN